MDTIPKNHNHIYMPQYLGCGKCRLLHKYFLLQPNCIWQQVEEQQRLVPRTSDSEREFHPSEPHYEINKAYCPTCSHSLHENKRCEHKFNTNVDGQCKCDDSKELRQKVPSVIEAIHGQSKEGILSKFAPTLTCPICEHPRHDGKVCQVNTVGWGNVELCNCFQEKVESTLPDSERVIQTESSKTKVDLTDDRFNRNWTGTYKVVDENFQAVIIQSINKINNLHKLELLWLGIIIGSKDIVGYSLHIWNNDGKNLISPSLDLVEAIRETA